MFACIRELEARPFHTIADDELRRISFRAQADQEQERRWKALFRMGGSLTSVGV
jgi:hypothetical protein